MPRTLFTPFYPFIEFLMKIALHFSLYRCLLRVLDTFGTEPVFNYKKWKPEVDGRGHDYGYTWGNWELNPRQFMTMYRKRLTVLLL